MVEAVRQRLGLARPYVLFVGTLEPRKNLPRLLEAFGSLDTGHELVLVGPDRVGRRSCPEIRRVRMLGFVDEADQGRALRGGRRVLLPSLREGFGLPVLEGMAHGHARS